MPRSRRSWTYTWVAALTGLLGSHALHAVQPPAPSAEVREFALPELTVSSSHARLVDVLDQLPNAVAWREFLERRAAAGLPALEPYIDPRSGALTSLLLAEPLIPGDGVGNGLDLDQLSARLGRRVEVVDEAVVADLGRLFLADHRDLLGLDQTQLGAVRATQVTDELWQLSVLQEVERVPVRDAALALTVSHGNVVVVGTQRWGRVSVAMTPRLDANAALEAGFAHLGGRSTRDEIVQAPQLVLVPSAPPEYQKGEAFVGPVGRGYAHRLVWSFIFQRYPEQANWELLVSAEDGRVLAVQDSNEYLTKTITGGVYPLTNTGVCANAAVCGDLKSGWPMPFADTGLLAPNNFANSAGVFDYSAGNVTTTLNGKYFRVVDNCGSASTTAAGSINLGGANNDHDCTSPGAPGNTAAARSAFYELNKIAEQARGFLPTNAWLKSQVTSNTNIALACNAFWSPGSGTVNFYQTGSSGTLNCANTGEIGAVFDHEWGHGLDDNDANGFISASGEAYADIASIYRLNASCVGHGFFVNPTNLGCGTAADGTVNNNEAETGAAHCDLACSGVRDADWDQHEDHAPDTALGFVCGSCSTGGSLCGRRKHCAGTPVRQMAWDLVARDLRAAPFNMNAETALFVGTRLFYAGGGNVGDWHSCTCGVNGTSTGCGATNGYMQWLAADDDDGDVTNGTPHMSAIFAAFDRHGIACSTPTVKNSGCSSAPTSAPTLTLTPGDNAIGLSWTAVAGASRYWVLRTEGHAGCQLGKTKIAETNALGYIDKQVANGRTYYYNVVARGTKTACHGKTSTCKSATPVAGPDAIAPVVQVTSPTAAQPDFVAGSTVAIKATASDNVGVTQVQFFVNNVLKSTDLSAPYGFGFTGPVGAYTVVAKASDAAGNVGVSAPVQFALLEPCDLLTVGKDPQAQVLCCLEAAKKGTNQPYCP